MTLIGVVPDELEDVELSIIVNDQNSGPWKLGKGEFSVELNEHIPINSDVNMKITINKSFVPKELGLNDDMRELSVVIKNLILE
ncbi:hypothetical protein D3C78_1636630 [compost metagenome]